MKRALCLFVAALCSCAAPNGRDNGSNVMSGGPTPPPNGKSPIMSLAELEPLLRDARQAGKTLRAVGRSVFEGVRIETFEVELLDIMKNFWPKRDLIMGRLLPSHPVLAKAGVIAGMSGSPIYVNGKMIGALAYSMGPFGKDPIIGITPIEFMIADASRPNPQVGTIFHSQTMNAIATPVFVSGLSGRSLEKLQKKLEPMNMLVVPAGGGSGIWKAPGKFEEGSAIGAQLVAGDLAITATGTVTYVDGDLVVAFGHPFFGAGPIEMPITTAIIHTVFPSLNRSFKISSPGRLMGALHLDRSSCIAGRTGRMPRMIPVQVTMCSPREGGQETINCQIIDNPMWFGLLLDLIISQMEETYEPSAAPRTIRTKLAVRFKGGRTLQCEGIRFLNPEAGWGAFRGGGIDATDKVGEIFDNEWQKPEIEDISIVTEQIHELKVSAVKDAWTLVPEVEDGGTVPIRVQFRKWRGPDETRDISIKLPKGLDRGSEVTIEIGGGLAIRKERPPASNFDELIDSLTQEHRATDLVAVTPANAYSIMYKGKVLERMPKSIIGRLVPALESEATLAPVSVRSVVDTDTIILGRTSVRVKIK